MMTRSFVVLILVIIVTGLSVPHDTVNEGSWSDLRWRNEHPGSNATGDAMISKAEDIIQIFKKAPVFNPPTGMRILPLGEFHEGIPLPENNISPGRLSLHFGIRIPPESPRAAANIAIWINDPHFLLGDPVLTDGSGDIFILPPLTGKLAEQPIRSRSAHPPGYDEAYPSGSMFPLWAKGQEPYLRSVVRPTFKLAKGTVTTMYTSGEKPFWKSVTQERWIKAMIENAKNELADFRVAVGEAENSGITNQQINKMKSYMKRIRSMYDEKAIIERHTNSMDQAMNFYNMMKETNPGEAEKYYQKTIAESEKNLQAMLDAAEESRAELGEYEEKLIQALITREDVWNDAEASIQQGDWDALEKSGRENEIDKLVSFADAGRAIPKLEAELKSLSNAQRNAPAYGFELPPDHSLGPHKNVVAMPFEADRPSGLVDPNTDGARPLVSIDPDFFSFNEEDADIKILAVEWDGYHKLEDPSGNGIMPHVIWNDLDWPALEDLVR
ncbi:MAG: hypothetical protein R6U04_08340 [Bacteroidales bacterium]